MVNVVPLQQDEAVKALLNLAFNQADSSGDVIELKVYNTLVRVAGDSDLDALYELLLKVSRFGCLSVVGPYVDEANPTLMETALGSISHYKNTFNSMGRDLVKTASKQQVSLKLLSDNLGSFYSNVKSKNNPLILEKLLSILIALKGLQALEDNLEVESCIERIIIGLQAKGYIAFNESEYTRFLSTGNGSGVIYSLSNYYGDKPSRSLIYSSFISSALYILISKNYDSLSAFKRYVKKIPSVIHKCEA